MNRTLRRTVAGVVAVVAVLATAGCSIDGRGDLPFAKGTGGDAYAVTVQMADVSNLVPNAEVKVNDVTVGTVTRIGLAKNWQADLTVSLQRGVRLPANAIANVGQKSLLGAEYLQLAAPTGVRSAGVLQPGGVIPIERTGTYPGTEELLIALSSFLNGSGLTQIKTIVTELNKALGGRTDDVRALLTHLQQISGDLRSERSAMSETLVRLDRLTRVLRRQDPRIVRGLPALAPGLKALDQQRPVLMRALQSVDQLNTVASPVITANRDDLVHEIRDLRPVLSRVADAGNAAVDAVNIAGTLIYPEDKIPQYIKGDYFNLFVNLDLRSKTLASTILAPSQLRSGTVSGAATPTMGQLLAPTTRTAQP